MGPWAEGEECEDPRAWTSISASQKKSFFLSAIINSMTVHTTARNKLMVYGCHPRKKHKTSGVKLGENEDTRIQQRAGAELCQA